MARIGTWWCLATLQLFGGDKQFAGGLEILRPGVDGGGRALPRRRRSTVRSYLGTSLSSSGFNTTGRSHMLFSQADLPAVCAAGGAAVAAAGGGDSGGGLSSLDDLDLSGGDGEGGGMAGSGVVVLLPWADLLGSPPPCDVEFVYEALEAAGASALMLVAPSDDHTGLGTFLHRRLNPARAHARKYLALPTVVIGPSTLALLGSVPTTLILGGGRELRIRHANATGCLLSFEELCV